MTNSTLIDREVSSLYSATLQATDTSNNTGTTVLEITLTDINDQPPKINPKSYNEFVKEGMPFRLQIEVHMKYECAYSKSQCMWSFWCFVS